MPTTTPAELPKMATYHGHGRYVTINVKDQNDWPRDPRVARAYAELPEPIIEAIYEGVREDFWQDIAPDVARQHGYSGEVYSEGRSGGWLYVTDPMHWREYAVTDGDGWSYHDRQPTVLGPFYVPPGDETATEDDLAEYAEMVAERQRFMDFAVDIEAACKAAGEMFVQRLDEALADLDERREDAIVRGEN